MELDDISICMKLAEKIPNKAFVGDIFTDINGYLALYVMTPFGPVILPFSDPKYGYVQPLKNAVGREVFVSFSKPRVPNRVWVTVNKADKSLILAFAIKETEKAEVQGKVNLSQLLKESLADTKNEPSLAPILKPGGLGYSLGSADFSKSNLCQEIVRPETIGSSAMREIWEETEVLKSLYYVPPIATKQNSLKENNMSKLLIKLADTNLQKELGGIGMANTGLQNALQNALQKQKDEANEQAANEILHVLNQLEKTVENNVSQIRSYRSMVKKLKDSNDKLNKAKAYGLATSNFVPLAIELGILYKYDLSEDQQHLAVIDESKLPAAVPVEDGIEGGSDRPGM